MADAEDRGEELLERSEEEAAVARRYLEETEAQPDPLVGDLPEAEMRFVHEEPPALLPEATPHCDARARLRDTPATGGSYMDQRYPRPCLLPRGHGGPHIAQWRWEAPKTWSTWAWD